MNCPHLSSSHPQNTNQGEVGVENVCLDVPLFFFLFFWGGSSSVCFFFFAPALKVTVPTTLRLLSNVACD